MITLVGYRFHYRFLYFELKRQHTAQWQQSHDDRSQRPGAVSSPGAMTGTVSTPGTVICYSELVQ